jgi:hypothetical protein
LILKTNVVTLGGQGGEDVNQFSKTTYRFTVFIGDDLGGHYDDDFAPIPLIF